MAGVLYLFRLFVYHAMETEEIVKSRFRVMEKKLYRIITMPAMSVAFIAGVTMLYFNPFNLHEGWMHAKLTFVFLLIGVTHYAGGLIRKFAEGEPTPSEKSLRLLNELPTVLMILIVFMVIVRPF